MVPRPLLTTLVFALPLLIVTFAVVSGVAALTDAMRDAAGAQVLRWISVGVVVLAVIDVLLLVSILGVRALSADDHQRPDDR